MPTDPTPAEQQFLASLSTPSGRAAALGLLRACRRLTSRGIFQGWSIDDWNVLISEANQALAAATGGKGAGQ